MARRDMKLALSSSLASEQKAVEERFARAESVLAARSVGAEPAEPALQPSPPPLPKVVRDSFTMPETDYALVAEVRGRLLSSGVAATKAEVLRAGLRLLAGLEDTDLIKVVSSLEKVKTGRPAQTV